MRSRVAVALALIAVALIGAPEPANAASAIDPSNKPTPVPGRSNGQLFASDVIEVQASCVVYRPAATSMALLLAAARNEGVDLGTTECYRPYSGQVQERQQWGVCAAPPGTSQHGWGKAVDFRDSRGGLTFSSPAFRWLQANAGAYGWNHPGWARAGGSGCDEPWHWEWVGDGGALKRPPIKADVMGVVSRPGGGWWTFTGLGAVVAGGGAPALGGVDHLPINRLLVGGAPTKDGGGYWLVAADGGIFAFGNAAFFGSMGGEHLNKPIVGMAVTPTGGGYWLVASDGGLFSFGDAAFRGSMGGFALNKPVVGMAAAPAGMGYWLVASDGGIFRFGGPPFHGSLAGRATAPVTGMAAAGGGAYRIAAADGTVTTFAP